MRMSPADLFTVNIPSAAIHLAGDPSRTDAHASRFFPSNRMTASEGGSASVRPGVNDRRNWFPDFGVCGLRLRGHGSLSEDGRSGDDKCRQRGERGHWRAGKCRSTSFATQKGSRIYSSARAARRDTKPSRPRLGRTDNAV